MGRAARVIFEEFHYGETLRRRRRNSFRLKRRPNPTSNYIEVFVKENFLYYFVV